MPLHADAINLSREVGANLRAAAEEGYLTNTNVNAINTGVQGLRDLITGGHADQKPNQHRFLRAIDYGAATSELTDDTVNGNATNTGGVEGLVDLTQAANTADRNQMIQ